ncbi:hypothetical protein ABAC460_18070 [Asticcacaulis sp. AC460]|uniref:alpha/beta hydrolase n=1 Tax=Asticcacaulis sp. AC460 TaxID=1282360 RepID=UPI0003C3CC42|nr:alpha/beta hydrolase [Asticcacaulis sp. AC460]ESQ87835.1 hypothetical protein ABAC460_18070 [Asticcacaulis sp. AC460]
MTKTFAKILMLASVCVTGTAFAQATPKPFNPAPPTDMTPTTTTPLDLKQIPLASVGSTASENWETVPGDLIVRNTTQPAIYPILPKAGTANGTAIVVAAGGGYMVQSIGNEGLGTAKYFADLGYTCFVLKYRLNPTPKDPSFLAEGMAKMAASAPKTGDSGPPPSPAMALAGADGLAAVAYIRAHAAEYGIDPQRIGIVGFSAGASVAMNVATAYNAESRPNFAGIIYGPPPALAVPSDAPPLFAAVAADDPLLGRASLVTYDKWHAAGKSAELHVYAAGGHGFGSRTQGTPSDLWSAEFAAWLEFQGFAGTTGQP